MIVTPPAARPAAPPAARPPQARAARRRALHLLGAASLVALTAGEAGAWVPSYSIADLTSLSSQVVVGTIVDSRAAWEDWPDGGRAILTTFSVRTDQVWKGAPGLAAGEVIDVVVPGGQVGGDRVFASCAPAVTVGQEAVLFLKKDLQGLPRYWVFGLERGVFDLDASGMAKPQVPDLPLLSLESLKQEVTLAAATGIPGPNGR